VLARANCLLIATLWTCFKFVLVPIGAQLTRVYSRSEFATVFALIWGTYIVTDALAEIGGSLFGKQRLRVWGIGDVNRKSIGGTVSGFAGALAFCLNTVHGLPGPLDRTGTRAGRVEHALRAVLSTRHRRFHHGHVQRADLLGVWGARPLVRWSGSPVVRSPGGPADSRPTGPRTPDSRTPD
jgi:hypothetical protein